MVSRHADRSGAGERVRVTTTNALSSSVAAMHAASRLAGLMGSYSSFCSTTLRPRIPPHALIWSVKTWNMSFTSPTGSENPSGSYFSSCERICTTLTVPLAGAGPAFVQNASVGANGFVDPPVAAPEGTVGTARARTSVIAIAPARTSERAPRVHGENA